MGIISSSLPKPRDYTADELAARKSLFSQFDADQDGLLNVEEVSKYLKEIGIKTEIAILVCAIYTNGKASGINFDHFLSFDTAQEKYKNHFRGLCKLFFDALDINGNGILEPKELIVIGKITGMDKTEDEIKQLYPEGLVFDKFLTEFDLA